GNSRICFAWPQVVKCRTVKHSELCPAHQPKVQRGNVRVADESLWVPPKHIRVEVRNDSDRSVAPGRRDHRFYIRVAPNLHQVFGALLVLAFMKASLAFDLGLENDLVARFFHRLRAAKEPGRLRRVRWSDDTYGVAFP